VAYDMRYFSKEEKSFLNDKNSYPAILNTFEKTIKKASCQAFTSPLAIGYWPYQKRPQSKRNIT
jgi:hypothetical protein